MIREVVDPGRTHEPSEAGLTEVVVVSLAREVARFVLGKGFTDLPGAVAAKAGDHIMDTVAVMLAAVNSEPGQVMGAYIADVGSGRQCTVLGTGLKASLTDTALANGFLAHGLDYDDSSWRLIGHPSSAVLPAVLAVAEKVGGSGKDLLTAYVLGTEVSCKLGRSAQPRLYESGWHATSVVGVLGAAAGCGYLLGLTEEQFVHALGIAASLAAGLRSNFGTYTKPLHAGSAARGGLTAALLAARGLTASHVSLEGKGGYFENFTRGEGKGAFTSPGDPYEILDPGFSIKIYPSCAATHTAIDAVLSLVREHGLTERDVVGVEVGSGPVGPVMLTYHQPQRGFEGKFSMPFVVAMGIIEGRIGLDTFLDSKVNDPKVVRLIAGTRFYVEPEFASRSIDEAPALVKIRLADGRLLIRKVEDPLGSPANPVSREILVDKFRDCTAPVLPPQKVTASLHLLGDLEGLGDVRRLIDNLVP